MFVSMKWLWRAIYINTDTFIFFKPLLPSIGRSIFLSLFIYSSYPSVINDGSAVTHIKSGATATAFIRRLLPAERKKAASTLAASAATADQKRSRTDQDLCRNSSAFFLTPDTLVIVMCLSLIGFSLPVRDTIPAVQTFHHLQADYIHTCTHILLWLSCRPPFVWIFICYFSPSQFSKTYKKEIFSFIFVS